MAERGASISDPHKYDTGGMPLMGIRQRNSGGSFPQPTKFCETNHHMSLPVHHASMTTVNNHPHRMNVHASTFFNNNTSNANHRNWSAAPQQNHQQLPTEVSSGGTVGPEGMASPKTMHGTAVGPAMYFNFNRQQQRYVCKDSGGGRSSFANGCHGAQSSYHYPPYHQAQHHLHNSSIQSSTGLNTTADSGFSSIGYDTDALNASGGSSCNSSYGSSVGGYPPSMGPTGTGIMSDESVTLQISNIDTSIEDRTLKNYLIGKLKPITPILSFTYEGLSMVKIRLPSLHHAKLVVAFLHRKKIRHKRISVAYSSTLEPSTLRCQVAGLLKDIPHYKLSLYKFRELFQSRFKTSISVMDLYEMKDVCIISENTNDEKFICLRPDLINSIENSELLGGLQLSVPYCSDHFKSGHRGWAELEIEPLPNVLMSVDDVRSIIYLLLKNHKGDIPIASLVYCIEAVVNVRIDRNEKGVNLEHLISCVNGVQIVSNKFGIKILSWLSTDGAMHNASAHPQHGVAALTYGGNYEDNKSMQHYTKFANLSDPFGQISREIIELMKMSPKSMMKFSRFIPAYHNHFGKQCRVADYGYTKLIELFEALTTVIQVMGDGENRQITLTHKCQVRCFTTDLLRLLRSQSRKSVMMSQLESTFSSHMGRKFDVTDYGVCKLDDILEEVVRSNVVQVETDPNSDDMLISIPKRHQSRVEIQKTCVFAGEVVDLLKNSSQFSISFEKIACSYHYIYGYQCRLNDYGFLKLADLMEAITGVVEIEIGSNEDRKVCLSPKVAQRVFSEQLRDITKVMTGSSTTPMSLGALLYMHKKQYGFQMQPQSLGLGYSWYTAISHLPYIEMTTSFSSEGSIVVCHHEDPKFLFNSYAAVRIILESGMRLMSMSNFINAFFGRFSQILNENSIKSMKHAVLITVQNGTKSVSISPMMLFVLRMIGVLEMRNIVTIADFKTYMNLGINDCFRFGYPNFNSLIQSFSDVFLLSAGVSELSEVILNKQSILVQNGVQNFFHGDGGGASGAYRADIVKPTPPPFQPWISAEPISVATNETPPNSDQANVNRENVEPDVISTTKFVEEQKAVFHPHLSLKPPGFGSTGKVDEKELEQFYTDPEWAAPDVVDSSEHYQTRLPLYERKPSASWRAVKDKEKPTEKTDGLHNWNDLFWGSAKSRSTTPDRNVPFWMDPVWMHESPLEKPLEIEIPPLVTYDTAPDLSSPHVMAAILKKHPDMLKSDA